MLSKREFFEINPTATEEDYKKFCIQLSEIQERIWNEDHPMDD